MDIILIPGLWLKAPVWDRTGNALRELGHRPIAVELPGADDGDPAARLDDQLVAVLQAVDASSSPIIVGHSAASSLAWMAADRRPADISRVALIGGFPWADGQQFAALFPIVGGVMAFPGWEPFEGPDSADLDAETREMIARDAVPVPEGVALAHVTYCDERRFTVPVTVICPEFGPEDAMAWIASGDVPELAAAAEVSFADIDSGHWPMLSRPTELAALIADLARGA